MLRPLLSAPVRRLSARSALPCQSRGFAKVVCVLYEDPVGGYPKEYARDDLPEIKKYPSGREVPAPSGIDFKPGQLLGSVSGELGLRKFLEERGHQLVVTSSKDPG